MKQRWNFLLAEPHVLLLLWLAGTSLVVFGAAVTTDQGPTLLPHGGKRCVPCKA